MSKRIIDIDDDIYERMKVNDGYVLEEDEFVMLQVEHSIIASTTLNQALEEIKTEIKNEIDKETYGHEIIVDQGIRSGYLGALIIIDKYIGKRGN